MGLIKFFKSLFKKKNKKIVVDEELISSFISSLGEKENIKEYSQDGSRVKVEVISLDKCNFENIKKISTGGVFVTGNYVKTSFKYSASDIIKMLDKTLK